MAIGYSGYGDEIGNLISIGIKEEKFDIKGLTGLICALNKDGVELKESLKVLEHVKNNNSLPQEYQEKYGHLIK